MNKAINLDIDKEYISAIKKYEEEIEKGPTIEKFANLAFLYWAFAAEQIEFNLPNGISDEWSIIGGDKFVLILEKGLSVFPDSLELAFWKRYFAYRLFLSDFSEEDCKEMISENKVIDSLVPYFFLNMFDENTYSKQIATLREICVDIPTAKNLYILTFIGSQL
ncbi:hypothetical protein [Pedobacter chitinilyticus]|uniref:Uncharacterized protein n=1 Tax=Pedobacter chitinilyticus TaxID=2233776 RepID=A0A443YQQ4_9SPHI|nr:hypothetical protein [Pedobacter chitinilyticus]RWU06139.1 hypothetical protein DPV69_12650 [Pedobacter chitinilyticus]